MEFATEWSRQNLAWFEDKPDAIVLYEELKWDFSRMLRETLIKLDIPFDSEAIARAKDLVFPIEILRPKQPEIYRTGTIDEWRVKVAPEISEKIIEIASPTMTTIGYRFDRSGEGLVQRRAFG